MSYDIARKSIYTKHTDAVSLPELDICEPAIDMEMSIDQFGAVMITYKKHEPRGRSTIFVHLDADAVTAIKLSIPPEAQ